VKEKTKKKPKGRKPVGVRLDMDTWLMVRRHRAETGETVSELFNRLIRANARMLVRNVEIPA
jgi:hypothetical protein